MFNRFEYIADILLFIGLVIVSYCLFLLYKELNNVRKEVSSIKNDLESQPILAKNLTEEFNISPSTPIDIPNAMFSMGAQSESGDEYEEDNGYYGGESDNCSIKEIPEEALVTSEVVAADEEILIIKDAEPVLCTEILQKGKRKGEECGAKNCKKHLSFDS